jgi:hypothetical protein
MNWPEVNLSGFVFIDSMNIFCNVGSAFKSDCWRSTSPFNLVSSSHGFFPEAPEETAFAIAIAADKPPPLPPGVGVPDGVPAFAALTRALSASLIASACGRASAPAVN